MTALVALMTLCAATEASARPPFPEHGLDFNTPAMTWDEALPLGNGIMGALVWGDGAPLNISLDRTDLWDLRPVPEFQSEDYSYAVMREGNKLVTPAPAERLSAGDILLVIGGSKSVETMLEKESV
ncbi:MAG: glycoside hydrolase N-terminal domain-containing protein [FCB group bacterium]|jgi:hypothetical protein|nr:glycoside hydrolase N-terminal domain-containing protein [FCB group bacterium]